ncbi:MAG: hypothetical protein ACRD0G_07905 [Acidimicrobiales bacterium]
MRGFHAGFAWVVVVSNALAGVWTTAAHQWTTLRRRSLWWFVAAAEVTIFAQAVIGVVLQTGEDIEPPQFHLLYGFSGLIAVGILYSYRSTSAWVRQHQYLVYGLGSFFLMGLAIRAMVV